MVALRPVSWVSRSYQPSSSSCSRQPRLHDQLGAAAYAAKPAGLAAPHRPEAIGEEIRWQLAHMSPPIRAALRQLPPVGKDSAGPLGQGLLASDLSSGRSAEISRPLWTTMSFRVAIGL